MTKKTGDMTDDEWRGHVDVRLDSQDAILQRVEGMLDTWTALRVGGSFLKWLGGLILVGLALMGYITHK